MSVAQLPEIAFRSQQLVEVARRNALSPTYQKEEVTFRTTEAAEMVGKTARSIRNAEKTIGRPNTVKSGAVDRRAYTIQDIEKLREHFGTTRKFDRPIFLTVGQWKGGVGKSTLSQHMAHYFASAGYRTLVIDTDPQGTTTQTLLGKSPDLEISKEQTIGPLLDQTSPTINPDVQLVKTNWSNVDIIPGQMSLIDADLRARMAELPFGAIIRPIQEVAKDYSVVIMDTPPTTSYLTITLFIAADILLCPIPPRAYDLDSSAAFFRILNHHLVEMLDTDIPVVRAVASMVTQAGHESKTASPAKASAERRFINGMRAALAHLMLDSEILYSTTTQRLAGISRTLYETDSYDQAWRRAISGFVGVGQEVEAIAQLLLEQEE